VDIYGDASYASFQSNDTGIVTFNELEKANWLIGEWQNNLAKGNASEIWEKKNDSAYIGKSYFIRGKDTLSSEVISLEQTDNKLFYIPIVKGQNNGQPVKFVLTSSMSNQLVFENPEHDFPQKISYTLIDKDSLLAEISGMIEGKLSSQKYPMARIK